MQSEVEPNRDTPVQRVMVQKKALAFRTMAILWIVPSLAATFILPYNFQTAGSVLGTLKLVRVEQWLSLLLLLMHPFFAYLAWHYRRTEAPAEQIVGLDEPIDPTAQQP